MKYQDIFNVRRYQCTHRSHHPAIYINLVTGERLADEAGYGPSVIPWHAKGACNTASHVARELFSHTPSTHRD